MTTVPLRHLVRCVTEPSDEVLPAVQLDDVHSGSARLVSEPAPIAPVGLIRFRPNDVLFSKLRPYLAKSLLVTQPLQGSSEFLCLRPLPSIDSRFLTYVTLSRPWLDHAVVASYGTKMPRTSWDHMATFRLPNLPVHDQRRIADFLDDHVNRIDRIVAARRAQQHQLATSLAATIRSGVAGVLETTDCVSSPIPWISVQSRDAVAVAMARVVTLQRGVDLTDEQRVPGDVAVVTTAGVIGTHHQAIDDGPGVVIGRYGSVGNVHWVDGPYWPHNTTLYVKNTLGNELRWIYYLLLAFPYAAMQARAAIPGINRNDLAREQVPLIPVSRQRAVVQRLDEQLKSAEGRRVQLTASIKLLSEYKQSLITAAVTGELDVTTAGSGVPG